MRIIFITLCMLVAIQSYGQEELNYDNAAGLGISFRTTNLGERFNGENRIRREYALSPTYFRRLSSKWSLGLGLSYSRTADNNSGSTIQMGQIILTNNISNSFQFSFLGRYWVNPSSKIQVFLQPALGYARSKSFVEDENGNEAFEDFRRSISVGISPGLAYQLGPRWRILTEIGQLRYFSFASKQSEEDDFEKDSDGFDFSLSNGFTFFRLEYLF